jgi:hypothetical protein
MNEKEASERHLTRRGFHRLGASFLLGLGVGASGLVARPLRAAGEQPLVTEIPTNQAMVSALRYVNESATAGQDCAGCVLYQAGAGGRGKCGLFQEGVVDARGWCSSWTVKP